ncbi:S-adenosyl-L-methionine-dependent methyltransferase, partial [Obba rivulosa]
MSLSSKDGRITSRIENYGNFWQGDPNQDSRVDSDNRVHNYTELVNGYYDGATVLYEFGWGKSFHFCRFYRGEHFTSAIARHEHYLAARMELKPGMKVLDVGSGVGGPALQIARFSGAHITGINNNEFQLERAKKYTTGAGLDDQVTFVKGDFMKLTEYFSEASFDAVYAIEATIHAPSWEDVYNEIKKVLKPGGVFGVYEFCMTDAWDPTIPSHKDLARRIALGNGIPEMRTLSRAR